MPTDDFLDKAVLTSCGKESHGECGCSDRVVAGLPGEVGRMIGIRTAAVVAGAVGGLSGAAYGLLTGQAKRARTVIGRPDGSPFNADGVYLPDGSGPHPFGTGPDPLRFAVIGDSSAAGLGVDLPSQLPGTLLAGGLAGEAHRPVRLTTYAISGSTTRDLADQVNRALAAPPTV